jgi:acetolactate synthase-1/3 small subunit
MKHTISILVENHPGVLARVSQLFSARGYNIESLSVGETQDPTVSRMTVVVPGNDGVLQQVVKQLNKLVDTVEVIDLTGKDFVERELVMVKIGVNPHQRGEVIEIVSIFRAKVIDMGAESMTVEVTGSQQKIRAFIDMMRPFGIRELVRTGRIAIARAAKHGEEGDQTPNGQDL